MLLIAEETRFVEGEYGADSKMLYTDTGAVDSARAAEHIARVWGSWALPSVNSQNWETLGFRRTSVSVAVRN